MNLEWSSLFKPFCCRWPQRSYIKEKYCTLTSLEDGGGGMTKLTEVHIKWQIEYNDFWTCYGTLSLLETVNGEARPKTYSVLCFLSKFYLFVKVMQTISIASASTFIIKTINTIIVAIISASTCLHYRLLLMHSIYTLLYS